MLGPTVHHHPGDNRPSISLLVGGIGIMNIMLATVTERTREIGIRRGLRRQASETSFSSSSSSCVTPPAVGGVLGMTRGDGESRG